MCVSACLPASVTACVTACVRDCVTACVRACVIVRMCNLSAACVRACVRDCAYVHRLSAACSQQPRACAAKCPTLVFQSLTHPPPPLPLRTPALSQSRLSSPSLAKSTSTRKQCPSSRGMYILNTNIREQTRAGDLPEIIARYASCTS
ncbi:hypothetical protein T492DRAFT_41413 [Pavlovales sp. CCMP2436]|nr:hypothetical protein T492DRAFT_41413 [Pavlovales sp. CCMP2436]